MILILAALLAAAPLDPDAVIAEAPSAAWRGIAPVNLVIIETGVGTMALELAPDFAPAHLAAIRALVEAGRFDGGSITRVQDNYVVQWAARPAVGASEVGAAPDQRPRRIRPQPLPAEYERPATGLAMLQSGA
jgi:peptidylprolyl isomerase